MGTYISMLRGINVGGAKKILMKDLADLYELCGFTGIKTYVQSGNVVFESTEKSPETVSRIIEKKIEKKYKFHADVLVRTAGDLEKVLAQNPFLKERGLDPGILYVTFLSGAPDAQSLSLLSNVNSGTDRFAMAGREIFVSCPGGYGRTKLSNNFFEAKLKRIATTRNWKTVTMLHEMAMKKA
jgi:uncharacterized protein (DUF1697 family)